MDHPGESRLASLAAAAAKEPFDVVSYRKNLLEKLKRISYPQPSEGKTGTATFYEYLQRANAIETVLEASTLQEIWRCLLIPQIVSRDRELKENRLAITGKTRKSHLKSASEALRRLDEIDRLEEEFGKSDDMNRYREPLEKQYRDHSMHALVSRHDGSRVELLSGHQQKIRSWPREKSKGPDPWNERLAAEVAVYWILRTRLSQKVSDRFLRQLSLLINAESDSIQLDEALRDAIENDRLGWSKHPKSF
jgi:hypothetical protein